MPAGIMRFKGQVLHSQGTDAEVNSLLCTAIKLVFSGASTATELAAKKNQKSRSADPETCV
jgi:hypothetical protein